MSEKIRECHAGFLLKWTNIFRRYQWRWFVLCDGYLSCYRSQEDVGYSCRGTINLASATIKRINDTDILIRDESKTTFYVRVNGKEEMSEWLELLGAARREAWEKMPSAVIKSSWKKKCPTPFSRLCRTIITLYGEAIPLPNFVKYYHKKLL